LQYYSNIYVVKDSANPENEGKVFLYRYGKKIFDKVMETMQPAFEDETPVNPFDFWEGANFKLKLRKVDGYWNYDKSEFTAPSNFKSYDELQTRLNTVLSGTTTVGNVTDFKTGQAFDDSPVETVVVDTKEEPAPTVSVTSSDEDDDTMSYFEKLAEEG